MSTYELQRAREREEAAERRRRRRTWPALVFIALFVFGLCLALGGGLLLFAKGHFAGQAAETWGPFAVIAGLSLTLCLIGWLALRLFLKSRGSPTHGARNFLVLFGAAGLGGLALMAVDQQGFILDYSDRQPPLEQAQAIDADYTRQVNDATARVEQDVADLFGEQGLLVTHLRGPGSLPDLRQRVEAARQALDQYETDIAAARARVYQRIDEAPLNPLERSALRQNFEAGFAQVDVAHDQQTELSRRLLNSLDTQLDVLESDLGNWQMRNGAIYFDNDSTLRAYNRRQFETLEIAAELMASQRRLNQAPPEISAP